MRCAASLAAFDVVTDDADSGSDASLDDSMFTASGLPATTNLNTASKDAYVASSTAMLTTVDDEIAFAIAAFRWPSSRVDFIAPSSAKYKTT